MTPPGAALAADWQLWLIENLLNGAPREAVVEALVGAGLAPTLAAEQVEAVTGSDAFGRLAGAMDQAHWMASSLRLRRRLAGPPTLPRVEAVSTETLRDDFHARNRPLVLTRLDPRPAALDRWGFDALAARIGDVPVAVNTRRQDARSPAHIEQHAEEVSFGAFLERARTTPGDDAYLVSKNGLLANPAFAALFEDLQPLPAFLDPGVFPKGVSLWIGPAGTVTPLHFDTHDVLLVQVVGRKRLRLLPPDHPGLYAHMDGYHCRYDVEHPELEARAGVSAADALDVVLSPGEALFLPVGWWHDVRALDPSVTLTFLNFRWFNHFHDHRPRSR
ncbi:MAG: cupin-like domain-containing protein [Alphaproteobacteria bacterium]|nr:cupin-like domain-containing protein [Alphaproteobacteria bacterium]